MSSTNNKIVNNHSIDKASVGFPIIKIKFILLNKNVKKIEDSKNIQNLLSIITSKRNITYKYNDNSFNILAVNITINRDLVEAIIKTIFKTLRGVKNIIGFECFIIISKNKIQTIKCMNKKCTVTREKINKFMNFINE